MHLKHAEGAEDWFCYSSRRGRKVRSGRRVCFYTLRPLRSLREEFQIKAMGKSEKVTAMAFSLRCRLRYTLVIKKEADYDHRSFISGIKDPFP